MNYKNKIDEGNSKWIKAFKTSDPDLFASVFSEDGSILSSSGKITSGRENIKSVILEYMKKIGSCDMEIETLNIFPMDNLIYETGKYKYIFQDGTKDCGKYVVIWKEENDGNLTILKDIGLPD